MNHALPELDSDGHVGLSFISVAYGVVLVSAFPSRANIPGTGIAGWFHLALAATMLVVSWLGYYTNRQRYPVWRVHFFNIPLFQYLISFAIIFAYWQLGVTIEHPFASKHRHARPPGPSPRTVAIIVALVFVGYLLWDQLEIRVQEDEHYIAALTHAGQDKHLPPYLLSVARHGAPTRTIRRIIGHSRWFAKDLRAGRAMSFAFLCMSSAMVGIIVGLDLHGTVTTCLVYAGYIVALFAYRYLQRLWPEIWYRHRQVPRT